jgi:signal peptidase I
MPKSGNDAFTDSGQPPVLDPSDTQPLSLSRAFGGRSVLREILETALLALIIFLVLNTLTGRFQVRGFSMEPTLHDGQYIVVSKLAYWFRAPERGDIVVFRPVDGLSDDLIKRVVGLPGERVEIASGTVRVDGVPLEETYIANRSTYSGSWKLDSGEYFVLGDNRSNSSDSHSWGTLPEENIIGKAWFCYWPPESLGLVPHHDFPEPARRG